MFYTSQFFIIWALFIKKLLMAFTSFVKIAKTFIFYLLYNWLNISLISIQHFTLDIVANKLYSNKTLLLIPHVIWSTLIEIDVSVKNLKHSFSNKLDIKRQSIILFLIRIYSSNHNHSLALSIYYNCLKKFTFFR